MGYRAMVASTAEGGTDGLGPIVPGRTSIIMGRPFILMGKHPVSGDLLFLEPRSGLVWPESEAGLRFRFHTSLFKARVFGPAVAPASMEGLLAQLNARLKSEPAAFQLPHGLTAPVPSIDEPVVEPAAFDSIDENQRQAVTAFIDRLTKFSIDSLDDRAPVLARAAGDDVYTALIWLGFARQYQKMASAGLVSGNPAEQARSFKIQAAANERLMRHGVFVTFQDHFPVAYKIRDVRWFERAGRRTAVIRLAPWHVTRHVVRQGETTARGYVLIIGGHGAEELARLLGWIRWPTAPPSRRT
jgi:hypothetical protein